MFYVYIAIALVLVAGGVTAVETYKHAITSAATANTKAENATQRAAQAERSKNDLQELVDYADDLTKKQRADLAARDTKIRGMEAAVTAAAAKDPAAYACERAPVPGAIRELRRATFGAEPAGGVLRAAPAAQSDAPAAAAGRDVRPAPPGGGRQPEGSAPVQRGEVGRATAAGETKRAAQSLAERIEAIRNRRKGNP